MLNRELGLRVKCVRHISALARVRKGHLCASSALRMRKDQDLFRSSEADLESAGKFVAIANTAVQGNPDGTTASNFVGRHKVAMLQMSRKPNMRCCW